MKSFRVYESGIDRIQPAGNVECVCYGICDVAESVLNIPYDPDELFERVPHSDQGTSPPQVIKEVINMGLLPSHLVGTGIKIWNKPFTRSTRGHTGSKSAFQNVIDNLLILNYPVCMWSPWASEWSFLDDNILQIPVYYPTKHFYNIEGVENIDGKDYLVVQAWQGKVHYMPEEVFNWCIARGDTRLLLTEKTSELKMNSIMKFLIGLYEWLINILKKKP